ncbi:hypothetical protein Tco_0319459 [Tanacetum coccineum]
MKLFNMKLPSIVVLLALIGAKDCYLIWVIDKVSCEGYSCRLRRWIPPWAAAAILTQKEGCGLLGDQGRQDIYVSRLPEPVNFSYARNVVHRDIGKLVLLVYKVTTVFHKVNAASSRVTTAERVITAGWIKTKIA